MPPVEVFERDHRLTVRVELPGIKKEEIAVTFTDGVLTIEGERTIRERGEEERVVPQRAGVREVRANRSVP
jgi:HSP20 family protein